MALAAGYPQATPLSFIRPLLETVERRNKQQQTVNFSPFYEALNIRETLPNIATSLRAFCTVSTASPPTIPPRPTCTAALALLLRLCTQPPDGQATHGALQHLRNITPGTNDDMAPTQSPLPAATQPPNLTNTASMAANEPQTPGVPAGGGLTAPQLSYLADTADMAITQLPPSGVQQE
jgi:hypothetical protein